MWSWSVWALVVLPFATFRVMTSTSPWVRDARLVTEVLIWTAAILTNGLGIVGVVWRHHVTGEWPWDGYTPRSALREWAGSIGLLSHHGRPGYWAKRANRLLIYLLLVFLGLIAAAVVVGQRSSG